jgi:uridine kinase
LNLVAAIEDLVSKPPQCGTTHVLSFDGRAGAGKTTLANEISLALGVDKRVVVVHMDEIYSGWENALGKSLTETLSKLLNDLAKNYNSVLPIFNWVSLCFDSERVISPCDLMILEGVGSAQELVRTFATATIWLDIDPARGLQRVLDRDGIAIRNQMLQWQHDEDALFLADNTRDMADFVLSTV